MDFGVRVEGDFPGARGHWRLRLYDLRSGTEHAVEERECHAPCGEARAERLYMEAFGSLLASVPH